MSTNTNNYFALFSLAAAVLIDEKKLEGAYQSLQKVYHPNRATRTPQAQAQAVQQASYIQDAYNTLINPATRLAHLLALHAPTVQPAPLAGVFLMEMMRLREQLAQHKDEQTITTVHAQIADNLQKAHIAFDTALATDDWQIFADLTEQMRFLVNMEKQISASSGSL